MLCIALQPHQKLGMILVNKVVWKLKLPKDYFNKNVLLNSYFLLKKKIRKIRMIFYIDRKLTMKVRLWNFFDEATKIDKTYKDSGRVANFEWVGRQRSHFRPHDFTQQQHNMTMHSAW